MPGPAPTIVDYANHRTVDLGKVSSDDGDRVDVRSVVYEEMQFNWELVDDLMGGTAAMQKAGEKWLPREPKEERDAYRIRKSRTILYEALKDTVNNLSGKPFTKPVTLQEEDLLPEQLKTIAVNADGTGKSITTFSGDLMKSAVKYGLVHILVDFPDIPEMSAAEEKEKSPRPLFVLVHAPQLIGYRSKSDPETNKQEIVQVRILESRVEPHGKWGDRRVNFVRVISGPVDEAILDEDGNEVVPVGVGTFEVWRENPDEDNEDQKWEMVQQGTHTFPGVPMVTIQLDDQGFMKAEPPLMALAWLNLRHWQFSSDQTSTFRVALFPMLMATGLTAQEMRGDVSIGPTRLFKSRNKDAKLSWTEPQGSTLEASETHAEKIEMRMEVMGLEPLVDRVQTTATGKISQHSRRSNDIQSWIRIIENGLLDAYKLAAKWMNLEILEDFRVDIFSDFGITDAGVDQINSVIDMFEKKLISHVTSLQEIKRLGGLSETVDPEEEASQMEAEREEEEARMMEQMNRLGDSEDEDEDEEEDDGFEKKDNPFGG